MTGLLTLVVLLLLSTQAQAQYSSDALLFGENHHTITARSLGVGNALGALGGDISTANSNPAGIGIYRRMEFSLSIGGLFDNTSNSYAPANTISNGRLSQATFGSLGMVFAARLPKNADKWKFVNFGISVNRLANYGRTIYFDGVTEGSRILSFEAAAQGLPIDQLNPYESRLAWDAYLIDDDGTGTNTYVSPVIASDLIQKSQQVRQRGGVNELGFSFAGNYNNKLYLGATIGVDFMSFRDDRSYYEYATNDTIPFVEMNFSEYRKVRGTGINLKIGMIYRINKMFRFGLAVHTPTAYRLVETYDTEMYGKVYYFGTLQDSTYRPEAIQSFQHNLATPWKFSGSVGIVLGRKGFIGIEASYTDYSWSNFTLLEGDQNPSNNQFIQDVNQGVIESYKGTLNAKIGGEFIIGKLVRFRLGYRIQTSPYRTSVPGVTDFRHDISGGIGVRWKHFFLDFAYVHTLRDFQYIPYTSTTQPQVITSRQQTGQAMLTVGALVFRDRSK